MALIFRPGQKILFIGDSITDCGRCGPAAPYGDGYVRLVYLWLNAAYAQLDLTIVNKGISGNTTSDLVARWERDVIAEQPDWLSVKIGVNDIAGMMPLHLFEANYRRVLGQTRQETSARLILAEPFLVEPDRDDPFRGALDACRAVVRQLAEEHGAVLVRTQDGFDRGLAHRAAAYWAPDRVHPTEIGHTLIAQAFLRVCGFEFQSG